MANTLGINFADDVGEFVLDLPSVLTWGSQSVSGTRGVISRGSDVEEAGVYDRRGAPWIGKISDFTSSTPPEFPTVVGLGGVSYTVMRTERNEDSTVVKLELERVD